MKDSRWGQKIKQMYLQYIKGNVVVSRFAKVFSVDVIVRGGNFIFIPVFLHLMSQKEIGVFDYLWQFAYSMAPILGLGMYASMIKMYHDYPDPKEKGKMLFTLQSIIVVFLVVCLGLIYSFRVDYKIFDFLVSENIEYGRYRWFLLIAIVWWIYNVFLSQFFVISENIPKIQRYNLGRFIAVNAVVFAALFFYLHDNQVDKVEIRLAGTYVTEMLVMLYFLRHLVKNITWKFDKKMFIRALKLSIPTVLSTIAVFFLDFSDKFFVQKYTGIESFAVYNKAVQFSFILAVIFASIWQIYQPFMFKERNLQILQRKVNRLMKIITVAFLGLSVCIWFGIWILLQFNIIPQTYNENNELLKVLPITLLIKVLLPPLLVYQSYMLYFEKTYIMLVSSLFFGALTVVANYFAVQIFGFYGSAAVLLIINFLWMLFYYYRSRFYIRNRLKMQTQTDV
ncbi:MAG: lipopolysaccharide biosynthesis protein [Bacteroidales bacterium]|jgi:O-antigen/teichoic acid export membrane protein|nr:lipopolysaccharide biosynthesis protein [Bacteroidales bacterium]